VATQHSVQRTVGIQPVKMDLYSSLILLRSDSESAPRPTAANAYRWAASQVEQKKTMTNHYPIKVNNTDPILTFETPSSPYKPRFLAVQGERVFDLGVACETCSFIYNRLKEKPPLSPQVLAETLKNGIKEISGSIVETVSRILPSGEYAVGLITLYPKIDRPRKGKYSFVGYGWVNTDFYRCGEKRVDEHGIIEQAIVPLFSTKTLNQSTVKKYESQIKEGMIPTALAITIAEGKHFMSGSGYESPDAISVMHFLIDGHHKIYAASQLNKPITLLSFLYNYFGAMIIYTHQHDPDLHQMMFDLYYKTNYESK
jgi:hypothetical protein